MLLRTPFYNKIVAAGGKMVEFTGYELPVQFEGSGIIAEHNAVRQKAGLFDVSHMGEIYLCGKDALATIQNLVTNDMSTLKDGGVRYTLLPNEQGGVVDDILIYRFNPEKYLIVVNAANMQKDADWIEARLIGDTKFENASKATAQLALQGPAAIEIVKEFIAEADIPAKNYTVKTTTLEGEPIILSRTGYTGEDGFELYCANAFAERMFDIVVEHGKKHGMLLAGLGARDTLRMEAAMPLYGHEMNDQTLCHELGLDFAIKMGKADFIGKKALEANPPKFKRLGIKMVDRGIAREHFKVFDESGREIGHVTSGTHSPTLNHAVAMIRVEKDFNAPNVWVEVRNRKLKAEIVPLPFYKRNK